MKFYKYILVLIIIVSFASCKKYLDIVPDNVATIDYAFRNRSMAERYLATCYSYIPNNAYQYGVVGRIGADEIWLADSYIEIFPAFRIARGEQNTTAPYASPWYGSGTGINNYWEAISQCNIFLENLPKVPDMSSFEKDQWLAEVKFLKAFYHFYLLKCFGPIPIADKNLPIDASPEEVRVFRQPVDSVTNYIVRLIDEAIPNLPPVPLNQSTELGRISATIALGTKAKVLVYAASPLFNGNPDYKSFKDKRGVLLFSENYDAQKWERAVIACKEAIDFAHAQGYSLYQFQKSGQAANITEETRLQMNARGTLTDRNSVETIWPATGFSTNALQNWSAPRGVTSTHRNYSGAAGLFGATMNVVNLYYSKNGVPIEEDVNWNYAGRFDLRTATQEDRYKIRPTYVTAQLNFDRESRFYGSLGFDGGVWYGNGNYNDASPYWLEMRAGQFLGKIQDGSHPVCGYYVKKFVNYENTYLTNTSYSTVEWPWALLRLSDLYLLYSEALNEAQGPTADVFAYLDLIRAKAALPGVKEAWQQFSIKPGKPDTKEGLREIIHRERSIELLFEGERYWDLRRWKEAPIVLNTPIVGWDVDQPLPETYYNPRVRYKQSFSLKDYFWPIRETDLLVNKNLVQNPGWK